MKARPPDCRCDAKHPEAICTPCAKRAAAEQRAAAARFFGKATK